MRAILIMSVGAMLWAAGLSGCGSNHPVPATDLPPAAPDGGRPLPAAYALQVGDELTIHILDQPELSGAVRVRPDGMVSARGIGDVLAAGRTVPELSAALRSAYGRILRYPDVSVTLSDYAELQIYVFGEVRQGGSITYAPNMTALHAVGAAAGVSQRANLHSVLILRRTGPQSLDVYRVDLDQAVDGEARARDLYLQPYDIVYVPRSWIGEINVFVDRFIRQNIAPFTAYIEGWRAFHMDQLRTVPVR